MSDSLESHAVVLGASMAGLAAARAVAGHFARVTVIDRDTLPTGPESRKCVPQGQHTHGLLPSGYRILDRYFPKMMDELAEEGGSRGDITGDFICFHRGEWKLRSDTGLRSISVSRPKLEWKVREGVKALPNVTLLEEHEALAPRFDATTSSVTGLTVRNRKTLEQQTLEADLTIDASGRGSASPTWLKSWGFGSVAETRVQVDVGYATALFERHPGDLFGTSGAIIAGTPPGSKRYTATMAIENDRWSVTLAGCQRDYPPTDLPGWREYLRGLPTNDLFEMLKNREPLGPITSHRFPANRRRYYETLRRFPRGYLVIGDAICSFNPIYGQGMTVALNEAQALDDCLREGQARLARSFFARASRVIDTAWTIALGEDFRYPEVEGRRPFGFGLVGRYMDRVQHAAAVDPIVLKCLFAVISLVVPPSALFRPEIVARVLFAELRAKSESPTEKKALFRERDAWA